MTTDLMQTETSAFPQAIAEGVRRAVGTTFASIFGQKPSPVAPAPRGSAPVACVAGDISFVGDVTWALTLVLPAPVAPAMARRFAGFDIGFDSPDMADVIGELANVLAGDVVAQLEAGGLKAQMTLPRVVRGHDLELLRPSGSVTARLDFTCEHGRFWMDLTTVRSVRNRQSGK